jgi:hypothetical protein
MASHGSIYVSDVISMIALTGVTLRMLVSSMVITSPRLMRLSDMIYGLDG